MTEAIPWAGAAECGAVLNHPFALNSAEPEKGQETFDRTDQTGSPPRPPVTPLGHGPVMPTAPLADGEDLVDAVWQARGRELALLERAREVGGLGGTQLISTVCEEWGKARVRAYVLSSETPVRKVPFPEELLSPPVFPPFRLPTRDDPAAFFRAYE